MNISVTDKFSETFNANKLFDKFNFFPDDTKSNNLLGASVFELENKAL